MEAVEPLGYTRRLRGAVVYTERSVDPDPGVVVQSGSRFSFCMIAMGSGSGLDCQSISVDLDPFF